MMAVDAMRAEMVVTDEDFRRFLTNVGVLSADQLVALDAAIKARRDVRPGPSTVPEIDTPPPADQRVAARTQTAAIVTAIRR